MRENRTSGSEGGEAQTNELSLPLSPGMSHVGEVGTRMVLPMVGMSDTILTTRRS